MKLLKRDVQKISNYYNLGKVNRTIYLSEGWVNQNFKIETKKGDYVIQILSGKKDEWKKDKMKTQFKLLNFLKSKSFPYEIPIPLINKDKKYLMEFKTKFLWVYPYIKGEIRKKLFKKEFQEVVKAMATFHKYVSSFKMKPHNNYSDFNWIIKKYDNLKNKKIKTKLDKLFFENRNFIISILEKIGKIDYGKMTFVHSDMHNYNILFEKEKVVGILDFDNLEYAPKAKDIATALSRVNYMGKGWSIKKQKFFIKSYRKVGSLSKKEESMIISLLLRDRCSAFWWFYEGMEKNRSKAYSLMLDILKEIKKLDKELKK